MTDVINEEENTNQLPDEEQESVVTDNGQTYESTESAIIAKQEADKAKLWAQESERQAGLSAGSATTAVEARDDAIAAKEYAEAAITDENLIVVATDLQATPSNIKAVATNISNVNTVAGIASDVNAVAGNATNINAVNANKTNIDTVAGDINRVNLVADDIASVHTVAVDISTVIDVADNKTNIDTVAGIDSDVAAVASISSNVTAVAGNATNINDVAGNATNINAVAGDIANINAVAADLTNINNASTYANNANIWAEGTDAQVQALGGEHSSKGWAEYAEEIAQAVGDPANKDLSNLSATGQAVLDAKQDVATAVNYDNISNCITEIPQDIKLELNNGTLTLKAGSKVYVPNGVGVFDVVTLTADKTSTQQSNDTRLYFYNGSYIEKFPVTQCYSGSTAPSGLTYMFWYDTTNNVVKKTSDSGSTWESGWSLPFCIATASSGALTNIDQVFNGFGYIGSTVFVLPGVKGLIPNGRNEDGSLKNIEFETDHVSTVTNASSLTIDLWYAISQYGDIANSLVDYWKYDEQKNTWTHDGVSWGAWMPFARSYANGGKVENFTSKTPFHALDYNDFNELKQIVNAKIQLVTSLPTPPEADVLYVIAES